MATRGCSWNPFGNKAVIRSWRIPHRTPRLQRVQAEGGVRGSSMLRRSVLSVMVADPSTVLRRWTDDVCYGRDGQIYYASIVHRVRDADEGAAW